METSREITEAPEGDSRVGAGYDGATMRKRKTVKQVDPLSSISSVALAEELIEFMNRPELPDQLRHLIDQYKRLFTPLEALAFFTAAVSYIILLNCKNADEIAASRGLVEVILNRSLLCNLDAD